MQLKPLVAALMCAALTLGAPQPRAAADQTRKPKPRPSVSAIDEWVDGRTGKRDSKLGSAGGTPSNKGRTGRDAATSRLPRVDVTTNVDRCRQINRVSVVGPDRCEPPKRATKNPTKAPSRTQLREVLAQLRLPNPTPRFGPDPSVNEWKMLAVGFPIWLWTDRPTHLTTTAHHEGLDFTLTATWTSTTFTMGDGHTKTCSATSIRPKQIKPATTPSPTCGYTYQTRSKPGHPYTVTAATHWRINWATNGYQGSFTHTYTGSRTLNIGELHSLING